MSKRIDHEAVLRRYLEGGPGDVGPAMRSVPATIDVALATDVVVKLMGRVWGLGRQCKTVPAKVIRAVLAREVSGATHLFLRLAVPLDAGDKRLCTAWERALQTLLDLDTTYAWGSKQRKAKIRAVANDPVMLAAVQGTVAHAAEVPADMLAVLVADGSAASYDALVAHIDAAFEAGDGRLEMLRRLQTHASATPELQRLFADLDGALEARNDASPALALGPILGIGTVSTLAFSVRLSSRRLTSTRVPLVQGDIDVDSRSQTWFRVWITTLDGTGRATDFTATEIRRDTFNVGRCAPHELPAWLVRVADKLGIAWEPFAVSQSNLRGKKREAVAAWLARGTP